MILKGSQRGGPAQLAVHLLNDLDNDHVELFETRGFVSSDLAGAMSEIRDVAKGTRCKQFLFSLSVNPPRDLNASVEDMLAAADRAEEALGLKDQPRALVIHEKKGRRHMHAVWSRVDVQEMKAIPMSFFGTKLAALSKELYLEHGWELPDGHRENGWKSPLNFSLAEWQQCQRLGLDPREVKQQFQEAWRSSDGARAFRAALEDRGYFLARGDRRGFVALDINGEVFSIARMVGAKVKDVEARLGGGAALPSVDEAKALIRSGMSQRLREHLASVKAQQRDQQRPLAEERRRLVKFQREERATVARLQEERRTKENRERQSRIRQGFRGVLDFLTGRRTAVRKQNELEALAAFKRDVGQREALFKEQIAEARELDARVQTLKAGQRAELRKLVRGVVGVLRAQARGQPTRGRDRGLGMSI